MRLWRLISNQSLTRTYTNQTTSWLVHSWSTFGVRTCYKQTRTHKTHHGSKLREATTFPLIIYFVHGHGTNTEITFCLGTLEALGPVILSTDLLTRSQITGWNPLEGSTKSSCENLRLGGTLSASNSTKG
jgi:hypothetical protein